MRLRKYAKFYLGSNPSNTLSKMLPHLNINPSLFYKNLKDTLLFESFINYSI